MKLAEIQARFSRLAREPQASAELIGLIAEAPGAPAEVRLRLYGENVRRNTGLSLAVPYKKIAVLLGPQGFQELVDAHLADCRPPRRTMDALLRALPAFLARNGERWGRPDLGDLARLELARSEVSESPGGEPLGPDALQSLAPHEWSAARLRFIAALRLLRLDFDVDTLWRRLDEEVEPPPPAVTSRDVLVWREGRRVFHSVLPPEEAEALKRALGGETLAEVCEAFAADDFAADAACGALAGWFEDGLVLSLVR